MRNRRSLGLALSLWFALIAVGSTVVWTVISGTGSQLVGSEPLFTTGATAPAPPSPQGKVPGATLKPSPTPTPTPTPTPSPAPTASATAESTPSDAAPTPDGKDDQGIEGSGAVRRSWSGGAGTVMAECTGVELSNYSALQNGGYSVHTHEEYNRLQVEFTSKGGGEDVEVEAWCRNGVPTFDDHGNGGVHSDDSDKDDHDHDDHDHAHSSQGAPTESEPGEESDRR